MSWLLTSLCRSMRRKLRTLLGLSWPDVGSLLRAWLLLLAVDLGLWLLPFRRVQELVAQGHKDAGTPEGGSAWPAIERLQRLVGMAGRNHLYSMRCLQRSLVLQWLLGRRGIVGELRIGVQKEGGGIAAHAWLEYEGQPIGEIESIEGRFAPLVAPDVRR